MKIVGVISIPPGCNTPLDIFVKKPIIFHVIDYIKRLKFINDISIVTDNVNINKIVKEKYPDVKIDNIFGCNYSTEMLFQYYLRNRGYDYYFLFPGNDPTVDPVEFSKFWRTLPKKVDEISCLYTKFFCFEDLKKFWSSKLIINNQGYLMYASRSVIPVNEFGDYVSLHHYKKNTDIYIFPKELLLKQGRSIWGKWKSESESINRLEENRFVDLGIKVKTYKFNHIGFKIEFDNQIKLLETRIISKGKQSGYSSSPMQQLSEDLN